MNPTQQRVIAAFRERFGGAPTVVVRAPGRVNLIGEHTDYNDGFVLPLAIERAAWLAVRPRDDDQVRVHSLDFREDASFSASDARRGGPAWSEYLKGCAKVLVHEDLPVTGWDGVLASDVPIGAGLSSSAAVELATLRAFTALSGSTWDAPRMAKFAQRAENTWVGVNCGIMDQMISATGREGHAILIDCRTLETRAEPLPVATAVVILDTATRRGLVESAYNERRRQCERAATVFRVPALRDITPEMFAARADELNEVTRRRARHVVTENERTIAAAQAMRAGNARELGLLMNASHVSLRDDFEVSSPALDAMVEIAQSQPGCFGARMTGAGFGGCAVALVDAKRAAEFAREVSRSYEHQVALAPQVYVTGAANGAEVVEVTP